jgi:hypothetical protein
MSQLVLPPPSESLTAESAFNYSCLLFALEGFENNKCHATDYFQFATDESHNETQFRYDGMLPNDDNIPLNEEDAAIFLN